MCLLSRIKLLRAAVVPILLVSCLTACGGRDEHSFATPSFGIGAPSEPVALPPDASEMARPNSASSLIPEELKNWRRGAEFETSLPHEHISSAPSSWWRAFQPNQQGDEQELSSAAYASYWFRFPGPGTRLELTWSSPPVNSDLWIGLGNWEKDVWDWYSTDNGVTLELENWDEYVASESSAVLMTVLLLGSDERELRSLFLTRWGLETVTWGGLWMGEQLEMMLDSGDNPHFGYRDEEGDLYHTWRNTPYSYWDSDFITGPSYYEIAVIELALGISPTDSVSLVWNEADTTDLPEGNRPQPYLLRHYSPDMDPRSQTAASEENLGSNGYDRYENTISMVVDSTGKPHIAYSCSDSNHQNYIRSTHWDGEEWLTENAAFEYASNLTLALDAEDQPHICFDNGGVEMQGWDLFYLKRTESGWESFQLEDNEVHKAASSMVLDSNDLPHILYAYDWLGPTSLRHAHWTGYEWQVEVLENEISATFASLAIDAEGNLHHVRDKDDPGLRYSTNAAGTWTSETVDPSTHGFPNISIDSAGKPHLAYIGGSKPYRIMYATLRE